MKKVRHILLEQKYEAEDVLRLLQKGQDFSALALKWSKCSSSKSGGELGDLRGKKLDPDFQEVVDFLKPGQTSGVVRTRFGYHIIKVEE